MNQEKHKPSVAVVILNWNGKRYLEKYLPSVLETEYANLNITVADNASTDDSVEYLKLHFPSVSLLLLDKNYGFAEGYNRALESISADYFVLLNSDVDVTPGWIEPVIELMESDAAIAACQPKILSERNRLFFEYAGASGGWIDKYGYPFCRGRVFDTCEEDHGQYNDVSEVFWASGACLFVRSEVFRKLGGLDPYFFAHQEEIDFCWRLKNAGYKVYVQPASVVYHLGGGSLEMGSARKIFLNFRNNLIMLYKNLHPKERLIKILIRMVLDGMSSLHYLIKGNIGQAYAVLKAHLAFYRWLIFEKRNEGSKKRLAGLTGVYQGSIVKEYFLKSKKSFSKIVENKK